MGHACTSSRYGTVNNSAPEFRAASSWVRGMHVRGSDHLLPAGTARSHGRFSRSHVPSRCHIWVPHLSRRGRRPRAAHSWPEQRALGEPMAEECGHPALARPPQRLRRRGQRVGGGRFRRGGRSRPARHRVRRGIYLAVRCACQALRRPRTRVILAAPRLIDRFKKDTHCMETKIKGKLAQERVARSARSSAQRQRSPAPLRLKPWV